MHDGVRLERGQRCPDLLELGKVAFEEFCPRIDRRPMSFRQIVENGDGMSLVEEQLRADASDIAGAANDENFHRGTCRALPGRVKAKRRYVFCSRPAIMRRIRRFFPRGLRIFKLCSFEPHERTSIST